MKSTKDANSGLMDWETQDMDIGYIEGWGGDVVPQGRVRVTNKLAIPMGTQLQLQDCSRRTGKRAALSNAHFSLSLRVGVWLLRDC